MANFCCFSFLQKKFYNINSYWDKIYLLWGKITISVVDDLNFFGGENLDFSLS